MYCRRYGRPPIDPVVLVKYLLVGYLYGIPSERQIEERISDSIALRWYLGIDLDERVPDHSTISQLRRRKPAFRKVFRRLFETVVQQCIKLGLASGRMTATDSTHVRANAPRKSEYLVDMSEEPGVYWERPTRKKGWRSLQGRLESDVPNELPRSKETSAATRSKSVTPIQRPATSIV